MSERYAAQLAQRAMVKCDPPVWTSTGWETNYLDGTKMLLLDPDEWAIYFVLRLCRTGRQPLIPVGTGRSGALVLGLIAAQSGIRGILWHPAMFESGPPILEWRGMLPESDERPSFALVDDCKFTGTTLRTMREAAEKRWPNSKIEREIVAWPWQPLFGR